MRCPSCKREVPRNAESCRACGYVVGMQSLAPEESTERHQRWAGDAVILGKLGAGFESFLSDRTDNFFGTGRTTSEKSSSSSGSHKSAIYVGAELQDMLKPEAVLERVPGEQFSPPLLSDTEQRVLAYVDGVQPVGFVLTRSGVTTDELCLAIAMLVDKGVLRKRATQPAVVADRTLPGVMNAGPTSETERNPVWTVPILGSEPPARDASYLHELVVRKLKASGLPVPADGSRGGGTQPKAAATTLASTGEQRDTLPGGAPEGEEAPAMDDAQRAAHDATAAENGGDYQEAARLLREASMLRPDDASILNRLGVVLAARLLDFVGARAALERAVELQPGSAIFANNLAKVRAAVDAGRARPADKKRRKEP
jgi:hypothetical protein